MKHTHLLLWALIILYSAATIADGIFSLSLPIAVVLLVAILFALLHGARRYRWSGILTFLVFCLVISNLLENVSILTGFPFGHYVYTTALGPKLFLVPVLIGPAYFSTSYLAWVLSTILLGDITSKERWLTTCAVPLIAAFLMVAWDLCFDPTFSTIHHFWIWQHGGGYFGVPLSNFLGWFLTIYLVFQSFALVLRVRPASPAPAHARSRSDDLQAIVLYAVIGLAFVLPYFVSHSTTHVTDAAGVVWSTRSIAEAQATISIFTMLFIATLSLVTLLQRSPQTLLPPHQDTPPLPASNNIESRERSSSS